VHLFSGEGKLGLGDGAGLERPDVLGKVPNAQVDNFLRFGVHGLEKRLTNGHVALTLRGLACAVAQDFRNSVRGVGALVVDRKSVRSAGGTAQRRAAAVLARPSLP
jgi:hypothetical protein